LISYYDGKASEVADAKNKLPELIKAVEDGEPVTIAPRRSVVDLIRTKASSGEKPKSSFGADRIPTIRNWWRPMPEEEVEAFLDGRTDVRLLLDPSISFGVESRTDF